MTYINIYNDNNILTANINQLNDKKVEKFSFKNKSEIDKAISKIKSTIFLAHKKMKQSETKKTYLSCLCTFPRFKRQLYSHD